MITAFTNTAVAVAVLVSILAGALAVVSVATGAFWLTAALAAVAAATAWLAFHAPVRRRRTN